MTIWSNRVSEAPALGNFSQILSILDSLEPTPDDSSQEGEYISRIRQVVSHARTRLESTDPRLTSENTIQRISNHSGNLLQHIEGFRANRNFGNLTNGNSEIEGLVIAISQLPSIPWDADQDIAREAAESFRNEVSNLKSQIRQRSDKFDTDINQFATSLDQIKGDSQEQIASLELGVQSKNNEFSQRVAEFQSQIGEHINRLDQTLSRTNDQFSRSEREWSDTYSESQNQRQNDFQSLVDEQRNEGKALIDYLQETASKAGQILGVTAASVTADAYLKEADSQKAQADKWRWGAVIAFIVAGGLGVALLIWPGMANDSLLSNVIRFYITRLTVVLGVVGLGIYLVKESGQHRKREHENRRLSNELTTFRPFLSEMTDEDRNELVKKASDRYFPGNIES